MDYLVIGNFYKLLDIWFKMYQQLAILLPTNIDFPLQKQI